MTDDLESRMRRACTLGAAMRLLDEGADEIARLRAGGCARDQRTTQWCAEAVALRAENERLRGLLQDVSGYVGYLPCDIADRIDAALAGEKPC